MLAAGYSIRLGTPKALARIHGQNLLQRTLAVLIPFARSARVIVVVPPKFARYRVGIRPASVDFVANPNRSSGLSSSVQAGIARARHASAVLLLPVDLARLDPRDIARLVSHWRADRRKVVARGLRGQPVSPLIFPHDMFKRVRSIGGDSGLRELVRALPVARVRLVTMRSANLDVDTPEELRHARRFYPRAFCTSR